MSEVIDLEHLTEHQRVLHRPLVYIGSTQSNKVSRKVYDFITNKFVDKEINIAEGLERLFLEGISNASDNGERSRQQKIAPGFIKVTATNKEITIYNTGKPFTIKKYKDTGIYEQEMAFGVIGTSTNYNDDLRDGVAGTNGLGIKLTNIYSKKLSIRVVDGKQKQCYEQTWTNNMFNREEPKIKRTVEKTSTTVSYEIDFDRFDDVTKDGYTDDILGVFAFHCLNTAFTTKLPVEFNGIKFDNIDMKEYVMMVNGLNLDEIKYITHTEWTPVEKKDVIRTKTGLKKVVQAPKTQIGNTNIELCIYDSPDEGNTLSFVNGLITYDGGVHVETIMNQIKDVVLTKLNDKLNEKLKSVINKENKDTNKKQIDTKKYRLNVRDLRPHVSIVVSCRLLAPDCRGQMKSYLNKPTPDLNINPKKLEDMMTWDLVDRLTATIKAKQLKVLGQTDGRKNKHINSNKIQDAPKAGTKESHLCTLDLVEGDSAQNYSKQRSVAINGGINRSEYMGSLALRGKPINVLNLMGTEDGIVRLNENKVYKDIKEGLGLREGLDYTIDKNFFTLRYGKIVILADADVDGKHIAGLVLLMFWCQYRSLLKRGKVIYLLRTPIVRVEKGTQMHNFATMSDFELWKQNNNLSGWEIKYCKGLASSSPLDITIDSVEPMLVEFDDTEQTDFFLRMAFGNDTGARKKWVNAYDPHKGDGIEKLAKLAISKFIDEEMIEHALVNTHRTVPGMDGVKEVQRKALFTSFTQWGKGKYLKTDTLITRTREATNYHYGPSSLLGAVNLMPLEFPGSNNLPYFGQGGLGGSRDKNGDDAGASRYTSLTKMPWWYTVFRKEDQVIWEYAMEEGQKCEPKNLLPIVPMFLINGSRGIGTAYSTFIPNYNPFDICNWLKARLLNKELPKLTPWYRGYIGDIRVVMLIVRNQINEDGVEYKSKFRKNVLEPDIDEFYPHESGRTMVITGKFEVNVVTKRGKEKEVVTVTEIPIGISTSAYEKFLKKLLAEKVITDYKNTSGNDTIKFEIKGMKNPSIKNLKLEKKAGLTNMTILGEDNRPRIFTKVNDLLEYWFQWRRKQYPKRIAKIIELKNQKAKDLKDKYKFVQAILKGFDKGKVLGETIVLGRKENKTSIEEQLKPLNLGYDLLNKVKTISYTEEGLAKIQNSIDEAEKDVEYYKKIDPDSVWLRELEEFEKEYKLYLDDLDKRQNMTKNMAKKSKKN